MSDLTKWTRAAWLAALAATAACQGGDGAPLPPDMPQAPCLCATGAMTGESCKISYKNAQICPDLSPVPFCTRYVNSASTYSITLSNRGLSGLQIAKVEMIGDDNCAFALSTTITPGKVVSYNGNEFIQLTYHPTQPKTDYALIRVTSNAENFGVLEIGVCGQAVAAGTPINMDGGACLQCAAPKSQKAACGTLPDGGI